MAIPCILTELLNGFDRLLIDGYHFYSLVFQTSQAPAKAWRNVHCRILTVCQNIWLEVKSVLCVDSPEGHTDEAMDDLVVGPKDILSYSWRALRESRYDVHRSSDTNSMTDAVILVYY